MAKHRKLTTAEIDAQIPAAIARGKAAREAGLRAVEASYDARHDRLLLTLTTGALVGIPLADIPYFTKATPKERAGVKLLPQGGGVSWPALDVDLAVEGLLIDTFGRKMFARALGRAGGKATSPAKASAVRANGAKGGRPRKHAA